MIAEKAAAAVGRSAPPTATEALALLKSGSLKAIDYISGVLDAAERDAPGIDPFLKIYREPALRAARRADADFAKRRPLGSLHGLPFAVKDFIGVRGAATTAHSKAFADEIAPRSATVVARLQKAGAILIGKLALEECGLGSPLDELPWPPARNPWSPDRSPGGSSSGSAAAVAAGLVPLALGTDTGGSIRAPAAYCGIVGLKPTPGRISLAGVLPLAPTLDTVGPMARTAADCELLFGALAQTREIPGDTRHSPPLGQLRLGVLDCPGAPIVDDEIAQSIRRAVDFLVELGARRTDVIFKGLMDLAECNALILRTESFAAHRARLMERPLDYGRTARQALESGKSVTSEDYQGALARRKRHIHDVDLAFGDCDVLALPVTLGTAPRFDDEDELARSGDISYRSPFNLTGHPALVFCIGFSKMNLPIAMQLVARRGLDEQLFEVARAYQGVSDWHLRRPPAGAGAMERSSF